MTDVVWAFLVWRYWRGIAWTLAWMFAFWAPALLPVPVIGWLAPPLLLWAAVTSRRRRLDHQSPRPATAAPIAWHHSEAARRRVSS